MNRTEVRQGASDFCRRAGILFPARRPHQGQLGFDENAHANSSCQLRKSKTGWRGEKAKGGLHKEAQRNTAVLHGTWHLHEKSVSIYGD